MDHQGEAGDSIEREYRRRKQVREQRARERHPRIGRALLWLNEEPQHQRAFRAGARGERTVGSSLERCANVLVLHNRRAPGLGGDIDHVAIAPTGVYVIDTKAVRGRVRIDRPWFGEPKLLVGGRDRTTYLDGLDKQVAAVRAVLSEATVSIQGALCFTKADVPGLSSTELRGHLLVYQKALRKRLKAAGPLSPAEIAALRSRLETALTPA